VTYWHRHRQGEMRAHSDLLAAQTSGISRTGEALVVIFQPASRIRVDWRDDATNYSAPHTSVHFTNEKFIVGRRAWLVENCARNEDLGPQQSCTRR